MVVCQPGMTEVAKSKLTTECTESTSGVRDGRRGSGTRARSCASGAVAAPAEGQEAVAPSCAQPARGAVAQGGEVGDRGPCTRTAADTRSRWRRRTRPTCSGLWKFGQMPIWLGMRQHLVGEPDAADVDAPGRCRAQITAKMVMASAERLIDVRHFCRNRNRTAEISVPA